MVHTAFVLGAGLGTRLRPLTEVRPKPLIPVCNKPLICHGFDHLRSYGIRRFVVNTHWLPETWPAEFPNGRYCDTSVTFRHEPEILETAGGIKNIEDLLGDEPFLVYNGDIWTDLPLDGAFAAHRERGSEVTLLLRTYNEPRHVSFDMASGLVTDIGGKLGDATHPRFLFTGVYIVSPRFLARIPPATKIGVVPIFLDMIRAGAPVHGFVADHGSWWDLGSRGQYLAAHDFLAQNGQCSRAPWIDPKAEVAPTAEIDGASAIGARAVIGAGAVLTDSIVWPGARVAAGANLVGCVVTGRTPVSGAYVDADL